MTLWRTAQTLCGDRAASVSVSPPIPLHHPVVPWRPVKCLPRCFTVYPMWDRADGGTCMDKCWITEYGLFFPGNAIWDDGLSGVWLRAEAPATLSREVCWGSCVQCYMAHEQLDTYERQLDKETDYKRGHFTLCVKSVKPNFTGLSAAGSHLYSHWIWICFDMERIIPCFPVNVQDIEVMQSKLYKAITWGLLYFVIDLMKTVCF